MNVDIAAKPGEDGIITLDDAEDGEETNLVMLMSGPWDKNFGIQVDEDGKRTVGLPVSTLALLGGKNGAGKSTLCMQSAGKIIESSNDRTRNPPCKEPGHVNCFRRNVLYVSAEEGTKAVRARAKRLGLSRETRRHIKLVPLGVQVELGNVMTTYQPICMYVDSISKVADDVAAQVEFCDKMRGWCEELQMPAVILSHINKEGELAGLESLQHAVDSTHLFTIDTDRVRVLETLKNRNGEDNIKTLYDMTAKGLVEHEDDDEDDEEEDDDDHDDDDGDNSERDDESMDDEEEEDADDE